MAETIMRLDIFLWYARFVRSRSAAQAIATAGHARIDGRPVDRAAAAVRPGVTLAFPIGTRVRAIRVERLPQRRGPAAEAATCYTDLMVDAGNRAGIGQPPISETPEGSAQ